MMQETIPPGWVHNPSTWGRRLPALLLGLSGFAISVYLTFYQLDILSHVWEPFFGDNSRYILKESAVARYCPVPDASLGALVYLLDVILDCVGGPVRWRTAPWAVLGLGLVAAGLGLTGLGLAASQPLVFGHYCTLCLASAVCSLMTVAAVADEVWATLRHLREQRRSGLSWSRTLAGDERPA